MGHRRPARPLAIRASAPDYSELRASGFSRGAERISGDGGGRPHAANADGRVQDARAVFEDGRHAGRGLAPVCRVTNVEQGQPASSGATISQGSEPGFGVVLGKAEVANSSI